MNKKVILVVDDETNIRLVVKAMLEPDYTIIEATCGNEGLNVARNIKPDLIFLDIMMPDTDGYTVCNTLKMDAQTSSIPVVMVTGLSFDLNKQLAKEVGVKGYITKPFKQADLLKVIEELLPDRIE
jgi:two-component system alkaline phosphatase synthesis response regulator PhoP